MARPARSIALLGEMLLLVVATSALSGCDAGNSKAVILTASNFEEKVLNSKRAVLVDFWADWCGPCRAMDPVIKQLAADFEGRVVVAKLNVDDYPEIAQKYVSEGIPTYLVFKDGEVKRRIVGARPMQYLSDLLVAVQ